MSHLPCFVCGMKVEPVFPEADEHQPLDALAFRGSGQYGSAFDGLHGELEVVICDGCLQERAGLVMLVRSETKTTETRTAWTPGEGCWF